MVKSLTSEITHSTTELPISRTGFEPATSLYKDNRSYPDHPKIIKFN